MNASLWALVALAFTGGLGGGVVFPILPLVGLQLGIAPILIGLILSLNRMTRLAINPFTGTLVDRIGARWPLVAGLFVEGLATLCFNAGLSAHHAAAWFLVGRALWGAGSSLLVVGALTAALIVSDETRRGRASAAIRMSLSLGVPAGVLLGGLVADMVSDQAAFLSAAAITFGGMLGAVFIAPTQTATRSASRTQAAPVPARHALRKQVRPGPLWIVWAFNFIVFFSVQGVILATLVLIIRDRHLTLPALAPQGSAGVLMAVMLGTAALVSWIAGRWIDQRGGKTTLLLPAAVSLVGGFALLAVSSRLMLAIPALGVIGLGLGGINVPLIVILSDLVGAERYGRAIGVYQALGDAGGSLGPITGLEAITRLGPTLTLSALATALTITVPLALALRRWERRAARSASDR